MVLDPDNFLDPGIFFIIGILLAILEMLVLGGGMHSQSTLIDKYVYMRCCVIFVVLLVGCSLNTKYPPAGWLLCNGYIQPYILPHYTFRNHGEQGYL